MAKTNNIRTRSVASDNIVKVAQSDLVAYVKAACPDTLAGIEKAAFISGNRQTVKHVTYTAAYDYAGGALWLIPETVEWSYQVDKLGQAERIELANMRKQLEPINKLEALGTITSDQAIEMRNALVDANRLYELEMAEIAKDEQYVTAYVANEVEFEYSNLIEAIETVTGCVWGMDKENIHTA